MNSDTFSPRAERVPERSFGFEHGIPMRCA